MRAHMLDHGNGFVSLACLVALIVSSPAESEIYRHVDEQGIVHFSEVPPESDAYEVIEQAELEDLTTLIQATPLPHGSAASGESISRPDRAAARARAARRHRAEQQALEQRCARYQARLSRIQSLLRAGYTVRQGNRLRSERRDLRGRFLRECRSR